MWSAPGSASHCPVPPGDPAVSSEVHLEHEAYHDKTSSMSISGAKQRDIKRDQNIKETIYSLQNR